MNPGDIQECGQCDAYFCSFDLLKWHMREIHKMSDHENEICDECGTNVINLQRHKEVVHGNRNSTAKKIGSEKDVDSSTLLKMYMESYTGSFTCLVENCQRKFLLSEELENHARFHGDFDCTVCSKKFQYAPDLVVHEAHEHDVIDPSRVTTSDKKHKLTGEKLCCKRCTFGVVKQIKGDCNTTPNLFVQHVLQKHFNLTPYNVICAICQAGTFISDMERYKRRWIKKHMTEYHNVANSKQDTFNCDLCPAYFSKEAQLRFHRRRIHSKELECHICQKGFRYERADKLRKHLNQVHKLSESDFPVPCSHPKCPKRFNSQSEMERHAKAVHKDNKNDLMRQCPHCDKVIFGEAPFKSHLKTHDEKYKEEIETRRKLLKAFCDVCGKGFQNNDNLTVHLLSHSGPETWAFSCDTCGKKCLSNAKLQEHLRTHTGEKPYQCDECGSKFAHRHNLRIHVNNKHGDVTQDVAVASSIDKTNFISRKGKLKNSGGSRPRQSRTAKKKEYYDESDDNSTE